MYLTHLLLSTLYRAHTPPAYAGGAATRIARRCAARAGAGGRGPVYASRVYGAVSVGGAGRGGGAAGRGGRVRVACSAHDWPVDGTRLTHEQS
jgi:hypothetical protein